MHLQSLQASTLSIPFNEAFKHASAERSSTQSLWVEAESRSGLVGFGEGCPREYVTAESMITAQAFVDLHRDDWLANIGDKQSLIEWVCDHEGDIDAHPAAWTAVELALLDLMGKEQVRSLDSMLGLETLAGRFSYSAVLGDASPGRFRAQLGRYVGLGFTSFKIKLSGDHVRDADKVRALSEAGIPEQAVRADANNLWHSADAAAAYMHALDCCFLALEEPLRPGDYAGLASLAEQLDTKIILDESFLREGQLVEFVNLSSRWIVNLRVSKMGGVVRSLNMLHALRERGLGVIIGAHVGETSILTRAALTVANCGRDILVAQEGGFGTHLLSEDVVDPPLMFGAAGILDVAHAGVADRPGLGLAISNRSWGVMR